MWHANSASYGRVNHYVSILCGCTAWVMLVVHVERVMGAIEEKTITPMPEIQNELRAEASVWAKAKSGDEAHLRERLSALRISVGDDDILIQQIAYARAYEDRPDYPIFYLGMLHLLALDETRIIHALQPFTNARDPKVREIVREWVEQAEGSNRLEQEMPLVLSKPEAFDRDAHERALTTLNRMRGDLSRFRPIVWRFLESDDTAIRSHATRALGHIGDARDASILVGMLYDPQRDVWYSAIEALGQVGDEASLAALRLWQQRAEKAHKLDNEWWIHNAKGAYERAVAQIEARSVKGRVPRQDKEEKGGERDGDPGDF